MERGIVLPLSYFSYPDFLNKVYLSDHSRTLTTLWWNSGSEKSSLSVVWASWGKIHTGEAVKSVYKRGTSGLKASTCHIPERLRHIWKQFSMRYVSFFFTVPIRAGQFYLWPARGRELWRRWEEGRLREDMTSREREKESPSQSCCLIKLVTINNRFSDNLDGHILWIAVL